MGYVINNVKLMSEWNWEKNNAIGMFPDKLKEQSNKIVWWKCPTCNHEWESAVYRRTNAIWCPQCWKTEQHTPHKPNKGESFADLFPNIAKEWNLDKNLPLLPSDVKPRASQNVWWRCQLGHEWQAKVTDRVTGNGCPYCSNRKALAGFNDLATINPSLASEWDYEKNYPLLPTQVTAGSKKKVWWHCKEGHSYPAIILNRAYGTKCSYCSQQMVLEGYNDLATVRPWLVDEWHPTKNGDLLPNQIVSGYTRKVWWKCKNGHEWMSAPKDRFGCPECMRELRTSFPEKILYFYIDKYMENVEWGYRGTELQGLEIDVYLPSKKIGFEYDGEKWHKDIERDQKKDKICSDNNITLYRIREPRCPHYNGSSIHIFLENHKQETLENAIIDILHKMNISNPAVDIDQDYEKIQDLTSHIAVSKSLKSEFPQITMEWNFNKNGSLLPEHVTRGSNKKVWWVCGKCGHEYQMAIGDRTGGHGCPQCKITDFAYRRAHPNEGESLYDVYPDLSKEWDYESNEGLSPQDIKSHSAKKVWWICPVCGHRWRATVDNRANGHGCPKCKARNFGKRNAIPKEGESLYDLYPKLVDKEWDFEANGDLLPTKIKPKSSKKVAWRCLRCGRKWMATPNDRTKTPDGHKCRKYK